jgi:hypothetical protein
LINADKRFTAGYPAPIEMESPANGGLVMDSGTEAD